MMPPEKRRGITGSAPELDLGARFCYKGRMSEKNEPQTGAEPRLDGLLYGNVEAANNKKTAELILIGLLVLGFATRFYRLDTVPAGQFIDEVSNGYSGWALLNYGTDPHGYPHPVVLSNHGTGNWAFENYFNMIPVALMGLTKLSARMTNAFLGVLALFYTYLLTKKVLGRKIALLTLFLLVTNSFMLMRARYGADPPPVMTTLVMAIYYYLLGLEKKKYLMLSALLYGLTLYTYPASWIPMPFIIILTIAYSVYCGKIVFSKEALFSLLILVVLAVPLLLFILVNYDFIPEIKSNFISVPKLKSLRSNTEFNTHILRNLSGFLKGFIPSFAHGPPHYAGIYTVHDQITRPFELIGLCGLTVTAWRKLKKKQFYVPVLFVFHILGALPAIAFGASRGTTYQIPLLYCCAYGIRMVCVKFFDKKRSLYGGVLFAAYALSFVVFLQTYFTFDPQWPDGYQNVVARAASSNGQKNVYIMDLNSFFFLFETKYPADRLAEDSEFVPWVLSSWAFSRIGRFHFIFGNNDLPLDLNGVYVFHAYNENLRQTLEKEYGFQTEILDQYVYAER
jgi:hypothetical protein